MKFAFIAAHRGEHSVRRMCQALAVSSSGFYAWQMRKPSRREGENAVLLQRIKAIFERSGGTYGSPRIHRELDETGMPAGRHRVARLMRTQGIKARRKQGYKARPAGVGPAAENLLAQDVDAQQPNRKWLADITYIRSGEGWLHLAAIIEACSRMIVGWSMSRGASSQLAQDALDMALQRRTIHSGLIHHSDRDSQYTTRDYQLRLRDRGIQSSMSGRGNCYDNAMIESFFATLKTECLYQPLATIDETKQAVFRYIEVWYNRQRRHSALGRLSPAQYERAAGWTT